MVSFLRKCTAIFEYCPLPDNSSTAQYEGECPYLEIEGKYNLIHGKVKYIPIETCEECLKNWLEGKE
jgi:hypothetical protein